MTCRGVAAWQEACQGAARLPVARSRANSPVVAVAVVVAEGDIVVAVEAEGDIAAAGADTAPVAPPVPAVLSRAVVRNWS